MKSLGLVAQICMVVIAVLIAFMYVEPTFGEIVATQQQIDDYDKRIVQVEGVNTTLSSLQRRQSSIASEDIIKLQTYLPYDRPRDTVSVLRDIQLIAELAGFQTGGLSYTPADNATDSEESTAEHLVRHTFTGEFTGTYSHLKELLRLLPINEYPLEVRTLEVQPLDGGFLNVSIVLDTFAADINPQSIGISLPAEDQ